MRVDGRRRDRQLMANRFRLQPLPKHDENRELLIRQTLGLRQHLKLAFGQKRAQGLSTGIRISCDRDILIMLRQSTRPTVRAIMCAN